MTTKRQTTDDQATNLTELRCVFSIIHRPSDDGYLLYLSWIGPTMSESSGRRQVPSGQAAVMRLTSLLSEGNTDGQ